MLIITDTQFNANPQAYLDRVDEGEELLLQRGAGRRYLITPVTEPDAQHIDPEYILEPDEDLERAISAEELLEMLKADIHEMFKTPPRCRQ